MENIVWGERKCSHFTFRHANHSAKQLDGWIIEKNSIYGGKVKGTNNRPCPWSNAIFFSPHKYKVRGGNVSYRPIWQFGHVKRHSWQFLKRWRYSHDQLFLWGSSKVYVTDDSLRPRRRDWAETFCAHVISLSNANRVGQVCLMEYSINTLPFHWFALDFVLKRGGLC